MVFIETWGPRAFITERKPANLTYRTGTVVLKPRSFTARKRSAEISRIASIVMPPCARFLKKQSFYTDVQIGFFLDLPHNTFFLSFFRPLASTWQPPIRMVRAMKHMLYQEDSPLTNDSPLTANGSFHRFHLLMKFALYRALYRVQHGVQYGAL